MSSDEESGASATKTTSHPTTPALSTRSQDQKWAEWSGESVNKSPRPADVYSQEEWESVVHEITQMDKAEKKTEFKDEVQTFLSIWNDENIQDCLKNLLDLEESAEDFFRRWFRIRFLWDRITPTEEDISTYQQIKRAVYTIRDHQLMVEQQSKTAHEEQTGDHDTQDDQSDDGTADQELQVQRIIDELQNFVAYPSNPEWEEQARKLERGESMKLSAALRVYLGIMAMGKSPSENVDWIRLIKILGKPSLETVMTRWETHYDNEQVRENPHVYGISEALKNALKVFDTNEQQQEKPSKPSQMHIHQDQQQSGNGKQKSHSSRPTPTMSYEENPLLASAFPSSVAKSTSTGAATSAASTSMATSASPMRTSTATAMNPSCVTSVPGGGTSGLTTEQCLLQVTAMIQKMNEKSHEGPQGSPAGMVKLPTIELTPFNGDPLEFQEFWRRYSSVVHNNARLDNSSKLIYLQSYLTTAAKMKCWGSGVDGQSYEDALKSVIKTFGDPDLLCAIYRDKILTQVMPSGPADIQGIRRLISTTRKFMNSLRDPFKVDPITYSSTTMDVFKKRVPFELLQKIVEKTNTKISRMDLETFISSLDEYCCNREDVSVFLEKTTGWSSTSQGASDASPRQTLTTMAGVTSKGLSPCIFCKAEGANAHRWKDCEVITDPFIRLQMFRDQRRCTACGSQQHRWNQCPSEKTCTEGQCGSKHHVSLHKYFAKQNRRQQQGQHQEAQQQQQQPSNNDSKDESGQRRARVMIYINNDGKVMMPIIKSLVSGPEGNKFTMTANLILDGGSDCSLITREAAEMLQLPIIWEGKVKMEQIGMSEEKTMKMAQAKIIGNAPGYKGKVVPLNLYIVEKISEPLKTFFGDVTWGDIARRDFPESGPFPQFDQAYFKLDCLLGTDILAAIRTPHCQQSKYLEERGTIIGKTVCGAIEHNEVINENQDEEQSFLEEWISKRYPNIRPPNN